MLDLYTLSQLNPLVDFMKKVAFNQERFIEALYDFKWHEVVGDYEKNVNVLYHLLQSQI